ncbi:hypothetical protein BurJ1DRAFT_0164 [Burkholderiales bacterium JOSHI_001]|nr:hypothetical protein BurJ1DRAFT_0164 [Burkholderiales bacterium JOSHI_001]
MLRRGVRQALRMIKPQTQTPGRGARALLARGSVQWVDQACAAASTEFSVALGRITAFTLAASAR